MNITLDSKPIDTYQCAGKPKGQECGNRGAAIGPDLKPYCDTCQSARWLNPGATPEPDVFDHLTKLTAADILNGLPWLDKLYGPSLSVALKAAAIVNGPGWDKRPKLAALNTLLECHGVEHLKGGNYEHGAGYLDCDYLNTGDTYTPTIMWIEDTGWVGQATGWVLASVGDVLEEWERVHPVCDRCQQRAHDPDEGLPDGKNCIDCVEEMENEVEIDTRVKYNWIVAENAYRVTVDDGPPVYAADLAGVVATQGYGPEQAAAIVLLLEESYLVIDGVEFADQ